MEEDNGCLRKDFEELNKKTYEIEGKNEIYKQGKTPFPPKLFVSTFMFREFKRLNEALREKEIDLETILNEKEKLSWNEVSHRPQIEPQNRVFLR